MSKATIEFSPPVEEFRQAVVDGGWLDDGDFNLAMGWGRILEGRADSREHFIKALDNGMEAVSADGTWIGWFEVERDRGEREVSFTPVLFCEPRYNDTAREALWAFIRREFKGGAYRIAAEVLKRNGELRSFLAKQAGFHQEGERWSAKWLEQQPFDTVSMVLIPPLWKRFKKKWFRDKKEA